MKDFSDVVKLMLGQKNIYDLSITGRELLEKLNVTYDDIYDFASETFYPLDSFTIETTPSIVKKIKTKLIIDESMWFKKQNDDYPLHETNGIKMIYEDCEKVLCSSGLTLQDEDYSFKDLYNLMKELSKDGKVILSIPYIIEDYYEITFEKGTVKKMTIDLSKISVKEGTLAVYQAIMLANNISIEEVLELID